MSPWAANSSVMRCIASSPAPMSNCMSESGGRRTELSSISSSWGVTDMGRNDSSEVSYRGVGENPSWFAAVGGFHDNPRLFFPPRRMPKDPEDAGGLRNTLYKRETRSKRRMTPLRRFAWRIVATLGVGLIRLFWKSCRVVRVVGEEHLVSALAKSPSLIPV